MSWSDGTNLFIEIWPLVKKYIKNDSERKEFTNKLIELFSSWDMDPLNLEGIDCEIDSIIGQDSGEPSPKEAVNSCIKGLGSTDENSKLNCVKALSYFLGQAGSEFDQPAADAIVESLKTYQSEQFQEEAFSTLRELVWESKVSLSDDFLISYSTSSNAKVKELVQYIINGLRHNTK